MNAPNIIVKANDVQEWVDDEVRPYLQFLLDETQRRIKTSISYREGMGTEFLDFGRTPDRRNYELHELWERVGKEHVFFRRFPELFEFRQILDELESHFKVVVGDILPTVRPSRS